MAVKEVILKLKEVLERKRTDVRWKLASIRETFYSMIKPELDKHVDRDSWVVLRENYMIKTKNYWLQKYRFPTVFG